MAFYVNENSKVTGMFLNVNGKKKVKSAWVNNNGVVTRVFGKSIKETDPYKIAPAEAYTDWNYTLDEENGIITLNYYIGLDYANPKKDVIVYANYVVNGKTYKTQIKSNEEKANYRTAYMFNNNFNYCQYIETIKFSDNIDTSNVTNMSYMFYNCPKLTSIDFGSNFDTSNVTNMSYMFSACHGFKILKLDCFNTKNVQSMASMFDGCSSLYSVKLTSFDTVNLKDVSYMFNSCTSIGIIDLTSFQTDKIVSNGMMFFYCSQLKTIYVTRDKWKMEDFDGTMFKYCGTSNVTYK